MSKIDNIKDYETSIDARILSFISEVKKNGPKSVKPLCIGKINKAHVKKLQEETGADYSGYKVILTGDTIRHIETRHGTNGNADNSMSDPRDIARIGYIINNFDTAVNLGTTESFSNTDGTPSVEVLLRKRVNGFYYIAEAVPVNKKQTIYIKSAYRNDA